MNSETRINLEYLSTLAITEWPPYPRQSFARNTTELFLSPKPNSYDYCFIEEEKKRKLDSFTDQTYTNTINFRSLAITVEKLHHISRDFDFLYLIFSVFFWGIWNHVSRILWMEFHCLSFFWRTWDPSTQHWNMSNFSMNFALAAFVEKSFVQSSKVYNEIFLFKINTFRISEHVRFLNSQPSWNTSHRLLIWVWGNTFL